MDPFPVHARKLSIRALFAIGVLCTAAPARSFAQAWVPPGGVGAISVSFQSTANTGHRDAAGAMIRGFDSSSRTFSIDVDYAFTDRLSITVAIPYVGAKYTGPEPAFFPVAIDECFCWNHGWQDINLVARYNVVSGAFSLTPSVAVGTPTHSYEDIGEAAIGRNLKEVRFTIDAGRQLDMITPRLAVSARYGYAIVEKVEDSAGNVVGNNRSNGSIEGSFMVTRRLSTRAAYAWQISHGGIRSTEFNDDNFLLFDRTLRDNYSHVGAGVSYSFPRVDVFFAYIAYVTGTDTHAGRAFTLGMSWPFQLR
jgi:hypothetical protein